MSIRAARLGLRPFTAQRKPRVRGHCHRSCSSCLATEARPRNDSACPARNCLATRPAQTADGRGLPPVIDLRAPTHHPASVGVPFGSPPRYPRHRWLRLRLKPRRQPSLSAAYQWPGKFPAPRTPLGCVAPSQAPLTTFDVVPIPSVLAIRRRQPAPPSRTRRSCCALTRMKSLHFRFFRIFRRCLSWMT